MQELESARPSDARRRFLNTSGKAALAAPAVALLLAAGAKPAHAVDGSPGPGQYFTDSTLPR